jgi:hypothetical protein
VTVQEKLMQKLVFMVAGERIEDPAAVTKRYKEFIADDELYDARCEAESELRRGTHETGLPCESSRHYSSRAVAAQMLDGSWVGWTYWFGGGKHGEPGEMPWLEDAYEVKAVEVQKVVLEFTKAE